MRNCCFEETLIYLRLSGNSKKKEHFQYCFEETLGIFFCVYVTIIFKKKDIE